MNRNVQNGDRILLRVVVAVTGLCAATFHWWLLPLVLVAGEFGSRTLLAYLRRPVDTEVPNRQPLSASDSDWAPDAPDQSEEAGSFGSNRLVTDPIHRQLPANIWHDTLD